MTNDEITSCLNGKDFHFDEIEIVKRLNAFQKEDVETNDVTKKITMKYSNLAQKEINQYLKNKNKKK
jgi:hypothetical protein